MRFGMICLVQCAAAEEEYKLVIADRVKRRSVMLATVALVLVALGLRVWGVAWSLPYVDHPDEPAVMNVILRIVQGQLDPNFFFYPSLILYLQALVVKTQLWWGLSNGLYTTPLVLPPTTDFYTSFPGIFIWARLFTAVCGTATVAVVATWGRRFFGTRTTLLAAALLAISPWAIQHAHYVTVDVPTTLFATLALFGACQVVVRGDWRDYVLAGVLLGLAAATKYQSGFVVISLVCAHCLRWRVASLRQAGRLVVAGLGSLAVFLLCSPFIVLDFAAFWRDVSTLLSSYEQAHGDVIGAWPVGAYADFITQVLFGIIPAVCALLGLGLLARRRPALLVVMLVFPVVLIGLLLRPQTHFWRNLLPIQPVLLVIATTGAVGGWELLRTYLGAWPRRVLATAGLGLLLMPTMLDALRETGRLALPDSRIAAQEMIRANFPGVRVASELSHQLVWNGLSQATAVEYLPLHPAAWYRAQGYGLLLASSTPRRSYEWTAPYQPLLAATRIVKTLGGPGSRYRGPRIDVLDTGLSPADAAQQVQAQAGPLRLTGVTIGRLVPGTTADTLEQTDEFTAGERLGLLLFWSRVEEASAAQYTLFVHLRDNAGNNLAQIDIPPWPGLFPPQLWPADAPVTDRIDLALPPNLPPGSCRLVLGLYDAASMSRFPLTVDGLRQGGDELVVATITVRP